MLREESFSITEDILRRIKEIIPAVFVEGKVDFEKLRVFLGDEVTSQSEKFGLQWMGKMSAVRNSQQIAEGTLRPDYNQSINFDDANNVIIEGDNLEVLRLMQKSYYAKVKMIYIDPPYNTGNEFIYPDNFRETLDSYLRYTGQISNEGEAVSSDLETSGRKHSKWLNMMYPRLILARNLLKDDGIIFVSIDDNEHSRLKLVMDEIFGEENFVANIIWNHTQQSKNDEPYFSRHHNSILAYRKSENLQRIRMKRTEADNKAYSNPDNDPKGFWRSGDVRSPSYRSTLKYSIISPSGNEILPPENGWRWAKDTLEKKMETGEIIFNQEETKIIRKIYLADQEGRTPENLFLPEVAGTTREATNQLKELFDGESPFDTPKPTKLIKRLISMVADKDDLIMDFFAGSGTTAHAVMEFNKEEEKSLRYILVQLPEQIEHQQFNSIVDITRERVIRAAQKVEVNADFKFFRLDSGNFTEWSHDIDSTEEIMEQMEAWKDPIKSDRSAEDVLYEIFLKSGFELTAEVKKVVIGELNFFLVQEEAQNIIIYLQDKPVSQEITNQMKILKPSQVWMMDEAFESDDEKKNVQLQWEEEGIAFRSI